MLDEVITFEKANYVHPHLGFGYGYSNNAYWRGGQNTTKIALTGQGMPSEQHSLYYGYGGLKDGWYTIRKYKDFYYWDTLFKYQNSHGR
jgi:hypothetical protein